MNIKRVDRTRSFWTPIKRRDIIKSRKILSKWGDVDFDGTPNFLDCAPKRINKDNSIPFLTKKFDVATKSIAPQNLQGVAVRDYSKSFKDGQTKYLNPDNNLAYESFKDLQIMSKQRSNQKMSLSPPTQDFPENLKKVYNIAGAHYPIPKLESERKIIIPAGKRFNFPGEKYYVFKKQTVVSIPERYFNETRERKESSGFLGAIKKALTVKPRITSGAIIDKDIQYGSGEKIKIRPRRVYSSEYNKYGNKAITDLNIYEVKVEGFSRSPILNPGVIKK